ncbi:DNA translocase FtsK [bacterium]|nr:DNA translocase FtsK [bacterium]
MARKSKKDDTRQEVLGILIMALALLIFLGLVSYNPDDFPNSGNPSAIKNWLGLAGSWLSHYLYVYTIGYSCLIFPFLLFLFGWNVFLQKAYKPFLRISLYMLSLGLFLSTALAMPEAVSDSSTSYGFKLSGLLGAFIADYLSKYLGIAGSIVVLITFMVLFLVTATSWSMREAVLGFRQELESLINDLRKKRKPSAQKRRITIDQPEKREEAAEKSPEINRRPPVIDKPERRPPEVSSGMRYESPARESSIVPAEKEQQTLGPKQGGTYQFPSLELLTYSQENHIEINKELLIEKAKFIEEKLGEFDVRGSVVGVRPGPVITRFEVAPAPGVKISKFIGCQDDLALYLKAKHVRVVAPIPGKAAVGIEVPNDKSAIVDLRSIIGSKEFKHSRSKLTIALGKTIEGKPFVADLSDMPHLLVAGSTGSGKSVCLNTIIVSLLYRATPEDVKLILIDPKKLELSFYKKLKRHHLMTLDDLHEDVITTPGNSVAVLKSLEKEMEKRYRLLAKAGVRNINDFNIAAEQGRVLKEDGSSVDKLPFIIVIVDELADLMITAARDIEEPIARLAQMARAVGIHLILATQRPSVDVITGVIKANFPSRIAFAVTSKTDSRTILDRNGAEKLLGRGDMLFLNSREPEPIRVHGAFISANEVRAVVNHIMQQPLGKEFKLSAEAAHSGRGATSGRHERDELFREAAKLVVRHQQGSASLLQRRLRIGYARAGRLIDELEDVGIVGPYDGSKAREVLIDEETLGLLEQNNFQIKGDSES